MSLENKKLVQEPIGFLSLVVPDFVLEFDVGSDSKVGIGSSAKMERGSSQQQSLLTPIKLCKIIDFTLAFVTLH